MSRTASGPRIAVLFAPRGAATLRDIARAAAGIAEPVIVLAPGCSEELARVAKRLFPRVLTWAETITGGRAVSGPVESVVTLHDREIDRLAVLASRLGVPRPDPVAADKLYQRHALAAAGLTRIRARPAGSTAELAHAMGELNGLCVLKPRRGCGGERVRILRSPTDLPATLSGDLMVEDYIPDHPVPGTGWLADYVSVEVVSSGEEHRTVAVFGKLPVAEGATGMGVQTTGDVLPAGLAPEIEREVRELTLKAVATLGPRVGVTHTEVKLGQDGPEVIEVNCRVGGQLSRLTRRRNGVDLVRLELQAALGVPLAELDLSDRPGGPHVAGVFVPFPSTGRVRSDVSVTAVRALPGVCSVDEIARCGEDRRATDGVAVNVLLSAPSAAGLRTVIAGCLRAVVTLFAADKVGESAWARDLAARLEVNGVG